MADNHSPNSNTFLKNLSQKKYAWMEEAITPPPKEEQQHARSKPQSPNKKSKSKRASPEPEPSSSTSNVTTNKKQKSPKPPVGTFPVTNTVDNTEIEVPKKVEEKKVVEPRKPQPLFKYTTFPVKGYNILPTRNITSTYGRNDKSYFPGNKAGAEEIAPDVSC